MEEERGGGGRAVQWRRRGVGGGVSGMKEEGAVVELKFFCLFGREVIRRKSFHFA